MTPFNHRRHGDVIRNTQPCPELAEALPALRSFSEGGSEAEGEASGHRIGFLPRGECEILRGVYT